MPLVITCDGEGWKCPGVAPNASPVGGHTLFGQFGDWIYRTNPGGDFTTSLVSTRLVRGDGKAQYNYHWELGVHNR